MSFELTKASDRPNNCVQATPDYSSLFIVAQVSGSPEKV
jgi:hypothetical protein